MTSRQYILELDETIYHFSGNTVEQISGVNDVKGDKWLIFDTQTSITRVMTVEAPVKYAEVIVRKKLQESGEFDEPVSLFTHRKEKKGNNTTEIFFTAIPARISNHYFEQIKEHDDSILISPLFSVLHGFLKSISRQSPVAVIFQHGQFADIIVGTKKKVYYANRSMAFDESAEQISSLWDMVISDITTAENEHRIRVDTIFPLNWINSVPESQWPGDTKKEIQYVEQEKVFTDGRELSISFPKALRRQSACRSFSPPLGKISFYSQRFLPSLNAAFFVAISLCISGYFWCGQGVDRLSEKLASTQQRISALHYREPVREISYKDTFSFLKEIDYCRKAPSYKSVVNDISVALPRSVSIEVFKVDYTDHEVGIEIFGKMQTSFDDAYKGYQGFTSKLRRKGYLLTESKFDTKIRQSEFLSRFTKRIL